MSASDPPDPNEKPLELSGKYAGILQSSQIQWQAGRQLERVLGAGGQGQVFLSRKYGAGDFSMPVALKIFSPDRFNTADDYRTEMRRIVRVAAEVACIQHDNVVDVQDFIDLDGIIVMEMEWVDGLDLRCLLTPAVMQQVRNHASREHWKQLNRAVITEGQAQSRVKPGMAIAIFRECLHGLASLHAANMVHNDLKPSNIMLKRSGNVKIIDIGSAFSLNDTPDTVACTPEFAAPEVLVGDRATAQSDLASLGYVLLEMLSGTRLFCDMKFKAMLAAKQNILQSLPTILPSEEFAYFDLLLPFLRRLVAPNPKDRFPSAEEADQAADGAAAFEEELVKGDLSHSYEIDIREWIKEIDGVILDHNLPSTKFLS
jgi:serine/threonine-protein kinase